MRERERGGREREVGRETERRESGNSHWCQHYLGFVGAIIPEIQNIVELHSCSLECPWTLVHLSATQAKVGHPSGSE